MTDQCHKCGSEATSPIKSDGGRLGHYCWDCETAYIKPSIVCGDVVVVDD